MIRRAYGHGVSYPSVKFVFITEGAALATWYHELAHITFQLIKDDGERIQRWHLRYPVSYLNSKGLRQPAENGSAYFIVIISSPSPPVGNLSVAD
jgi:hypothetical protein